MCVVEQYISVFPDGRRENRERVITCPRGTPSHPCSRREYINLNVERLENIDVRSDIANGPSTGFKWKWHRPFKKRDKKSQKHGKRKPSVVIHSGAESTDSDSETSGDDDGSKSPEPTRAHARVPLRVSDEQARLEDESAQRAKREESALRAQRHALTERAARERAQRQHEDEVRRERRAHYRHAPARYRLESAPQQKAPEMGHVEGRSKRSYLPDRLLGSLTPRSPSARKQDTKVESAPPPKLSQNLEESGFQHTYSDMPQEIGGKRLRSKKFIKHDQPWPIDNEAPNLCDAKNANESQYDEKAKESATTFDSDAMASRNLTLFLGNTYTSKGYEDVSSTMTAPHDWESYVTSIESHLKSFTSHEPSSNKETLFDDESARAYLFGLFSHDSKSRELIDKARTMCSEASFERHLVRLLKEYALSLKSEASSQSERNASSLIYRRANHLASHIVRIVFMRPDIVEPSRSARLASAGVISTEQFLDQLISDSSTGESVGTETVSKSSKPDDDPPEWPNLSILRHFLVGGSAFNRFRANLAESLAQDSDVLPEKDNGARSSVKGPVNENGIAPRITNDAEDCMNHSIETARSDNIPSSVDLPFIGYSYKRFDFHSAAESTEVEVQKPTDIQPAQNPPRPSGVARQVASRIATLAVRMIPTAFERATSTLNGMAGLYAYFYGKAHTKNIKWTCECGEKLTWDVPNISDREAKMMAAYLDRANSNTSSSSSSRNSNSSSSPSNTSNTSTEATSLPSNGDFHLDGDVSIAVSQPQDEAVVERRIKPRFLELCVNTGPYCKELGEISLTNIKSDGELFHDIAATYRRVRGERGIIRLGLPAFCKARSEQPCTDNALFDVLSVVLNKMIPNGLQRWLGNIRCQFSFMKPSSIIFRKFIIDSGSTIGVFDPELPPPCEITSERYQYNPNPLRPCEVMPSHLFFHYFHNPTPHYNSKWMPRFPKKLKSSIYSSTDQLPVGWGIHIVESCNYHVIALALFVGLVVSGVLAVVWAMVKQDVQGGFSIGTYVVALQTTWMTTMFFKWKDY